jgi:hypothetical protein
MAQLKNATVLTSSGISRRLSLFRYGREIVVEQESGSIHLSTEGDRMKLYIPKRRSDRDLCLKSQVPKRLVKFLGVTEPGAEALLSNIINLNTMRSVLQLLEDEGVINIHGVVPDETAMEDEDSDTESQLNSIMSSTRLTPSTPRSAPQDSPLTPPQSSSRLSTFQQGRVRTPTPSTVPFGNPQSRNVGSAFDTGEPVSSRQSSDSVPPDDTNLQADQQPFGMDTGRTLSGYSKILDRCRNAARDMSPAPHGISELYHTNALPADLRTTFEALFPVRSLERDRLVGAAGELFVSYRIQSKMPIY